MELSWAIIFGTWRPWFDIWWKGREDGYTIDIGFTIFKTSFYFWIRPNKW